MDAAGFRTLRSFTRDPSVGKKRLAAG
ncbi:MAG: hypothetical protein QOE76_1861, partial [Frankiales bacterium]|nr:hypothetical protein [Frankiales bacterium]